ncbi:MAG TPA: hypothetical protein VJ761_24760, partial [Ktedonobacteraceae bacterium]|nr:hypothetical protein [Ktedonobacteraceae bacterium]
MPKKTAHTRSSTQQRRRPKAQKSIELVHPVSVEDKSENQDDVEPTSVGIATSTAPVLEIESEKVAAPTSRSKKETASSLKSEKSSSPKVEKAPVLRTEEKDEPAEVAEETVPAPKASASARIAARRQAAQKTSRTASLISAENYSYVRKDLVIIAILA